ncbi:MAG: AmmeMemoRadiSam system protein A [Chthoniobacterales bacterium]
MFSEKEKKMLLLLARRALEEYVKHHHILTVQELDLVMTPALEEPRGVFVTLYQQWNTLPKTLRGCIGTIPPLRPLYQGVIANAINAASRDARFLPVREEELQELVVEINVLTPPHLIDSYHSIRLGEDGIILSQGSRQAVFLPAVPLEWKWSLEETLRQLSKKADLPENSWQDDVTQFQVFQSEAFSEQPEI